MVASGHNSWTTVLLDVLMCFIITVVISFKVCKEVVEDVGGHRFALLLLCDHLDGLVILVVSFGVCSSPFLKVGKIYPDTKWKSKTEEVSTAANCFAG